MNSQIGVNREMARKLAKKPTGDKEVDITACQACGAGKQAGMGYTGHVE